ncbi:MAG TPA: ABC transporter substrate-binding protein, partial [Candidatus Bathyarchaeia archaeon]|nr:ABC transporter substrate-binding protein [Candidatus Bathyarchaeia archaeon]
AIDSCTPYPYNPTLAKQLLTEAGYPNGFNITLETTSGRYVYDKEVAQIAQAQLAEVGINVNIRINEYSAHFSRLREPVATYPQMAICGWGTSTGDPDYFITQCYYSKVMPPLSLNPYYKNDAVDALIEQGASETNITRRAEIYAQIQQLVWDDVPMIWLYTQPTVYAWIYNLHGVQIMPTGAINMRGAYID